MLLIYDYEKQHFAPWLLKSNILVWLVNAKKSGSKAPLALDPSLSHQWGEIDEENNNNNSKMTSKQLAWLRSKKV